MRAVFWSFPVLVGLSQPVLWQMNVRVARFTGVVEAAVILHVIGAAVGMVYWVGGLRAPGSYAGVSGIPWWAWLGGAVGVSGMVAMTRAIPEVGVGSALALNVAAQLAFALVFEHYGWMGADLHTITPGRCLGAGLLVVGAWLVTR